MSESLFNRAKIVLPCGVNSPVRFYEPYPFFVSYGNGSKIITSDHQTMIDYCMGYGALLFGHAFADVIEAVKSQMNAGTLFCIPTEQEVKFAELLSSIIPGAEMVRMMNTGSEATMNAIRLSRSFTKKKRIIKFDGCYHGSYDYVLVNAGSGAAASKEIHGNLEEAAKQTIVLPYNDINYLEEVINKEDDIACVIIEPVLANMGLVLPQEDFLSDLRSITEKNGIVLIFDEVVTGFRLNIGGASEYFGVIPDITTLGKAIGNGFPLSAVVGKKEIIEQFAPSGRVYQGSTFAGNPLSMSAGLATVNKILEIKNDLYPKLSRLCDSLVNGIKDQMKGNNLNFRINHISSMYQLFLTNNEVLNAEDVRHCDIIHYKILFQELVKLGVFVPPSQYETCFLSYSHDEDDVDRTIDAYGNALRKVKES